MIDLRNEDALSVFAAESYTYASQKCAYVSDNDTVS